MTGRAPVDKGQELRYLRRYDSRSTRAVRRGLVLLRRAVVVAGHGALLALTLWAGVRVAERLVGSAEFDLARIRLEGASRADAAGILADLDRHRGENLLELDLESIESDVRRHPWIEDAAVRRVLPDTLLVEVREVEPRAMAVVDGNLHFVDAAGRVVETVEAVRDADLPVVVGVRAAAGDEPDPGLVRAVAWLERLERRNPALARDVSELDLSDPDRATVRTTSSGPLLHLDPIRAERNVEDYLRIRERVLRRFDDVAHVDLRWEGRISVLPRATTGTEREDG